MSEFNVRKSQLDDLDEIARIYANEVLHGLATFETKPPPANELALRRMAILTANLPYIVASIDNHVVGFAYASPYRARAAYQNSIENSVYVDSKARQQGVGSILLETLIHSCEHGPWRQMIAVIGDSNNLGSIALHKKLGFRHVGTIEAV
ncbi:UNVERIFIED_CONTAM: hypothetical protein GTU68_051207, partial [Idotea baltica]|nr:hypothetical protein [Idotea baltica]